MIMNGTEATMMEGKMENTYGIEIEFTNITRKNAAEVIRKTLNGTYKEGTTRDTYLIEDQQGRGWKLTKDVSIHGTSSQQCELVTPILTMPDLPTLKAIVEALKEAGARSTNKLGAGIHLHLGSQNHTVQTIRNLVNIMAAHEDQLFKAFGVEETRIDRYCQRTEKKFIEALNQAKPSTMDELRELWYTNNGGMEMTESHYHRSRYHALNLHALFTRYHTIEIRLGQWTRENSFDWTALESFIRICMAMNDLALSSKTASPKRQADWTSAYAFRCWLLRLGFIGEETKEVRKFLLKNFEGDKAWRRVA